MNEKILIIDDEPEILELLGETLQDEGYRTIKASDGKRGLELLQSENPDLVLTDVRMPKMDGLSVLNHINYSGSDAEVIILTGHSDEATAIRCLRAGAFDYLQKPVEDIFTLINAVNRAIYKRFLSLENKQLVIQLREKNQELHLIKEDLEKKVKERTLEYKKAKEKAEEAEIAAVSAYQIKNLFLSNMSHEIRTPMNSILGFIDIVLERVEMEENSRNLLKTAHGSAEQLLVLLSDILDICHLDAGEMNIKNSRIQPAKLLDKILKSQSTKINNKDIALNLDIQIEQDLCIICDQKKLKTVLTKLIDNAIKFTETGTILVSVEVNSNGMLQFSVKDTGIGISADIIDMIFELFTQADQTTSRMYGGTGLGTTISKQMVKLMGGDIWVNSEEGKGSTFYFTIPLNCYQKDSKGRV